jgi:hypothetical protein
VVGKVPVRRLGMARYLAGIAALAASVVAIGAWIDLTPRSAASDVTVIYIGAEDCAPCRAWRRDGWPQFAASAEYSRLIYREVTSPRLADLLNDEYWPSDLRRYRDKLDRSAGVPLWFVIANDAKPVLMARGLREWEALVLPKIRSLVREVNGAM